MNWNDLRTFLAVAEAGNLNGAARHLGQNHSTVFRRLNALEEDLGSRLFERLPDGYVLTPSGERLVSLARQADAAVQQIELELAGQDLAPTGTVRVTAAPNIARTIVAEAVAELRQSHPGILVEVLAGDSDYDLSRREADIAVRATTRPPPQLVGRKVADLCWHLCRASAARSATPRKVPDIAGLPMIGADARLMRLEVFKWLEHEYPESVVARANDLTSMAAMARAGVGYALLPSDQPERGIKRLLAIPGINSQLWLLTHPELRGITRNRVVWEALVKRATSLLKT